jgi:hypothetical protein
MHTAIAQAHPNIAFGCEISQGLISIKISGDHRMSLPKNANAFLAITIAYKLPFLGNVKNFV